MDRSLVEQVSSIILPLPEDIIIEILSYLQCRDILKLIKISNKIKDICIRNNIIEKCKFYGFPRSKGHCKIHFLFFHLTDFKSVSWNNLKYETDILLDSLFISTQYYKPEQLIRGDIIIVKNNIDVGTKYEEFVFDGNKLLYISKNLPEEFEVIKYNVPFDYWTTFYKISYIPEEIRKDAWFNYDDRIRNELSNNINTETIHYLKSYFTLNDKIYYVNVGYHFTNGYYPGIKNLQSRVDIFKNYIMTNTKYPFTICGDILTIILDFPNNI